MKQDRAASSGRVTVYLNGGGQRVQAGYEDSTANRSSIVWSSGRSAIDVPAYSGGSSRWRSMVSCVQDHFRGYDVAITDERPGSGTYIMMMVGGRSSMLGYPDSVGGVAPYTGGIVDEAIGYVFSASMGNDARSVCETTSHEIGHTLGLDHTYECTDLMSYLHGCGDKSFQDRSMRCGEWDDRDCSSGERRQNSHQHLARTVGLRRNRPEPTKPTPSPRKPTPPPTPADTRGPRISVRSMGGTTFEAESIFVIQFEAHDDSGLASIELVWRNGGRTTVFRCGDLPANMPIECGMIGGDYAFALVVGEGERRFAIRATDQAGNTSTTRWRKASFVNPEVIWDDEWEEDGQTDDCW